MGIMVGLGCFIIAIIAAVIVSCLCIAEGRYNKKKEEIELVTITDERGEQNGKI